MSVQGGSENIAWAVEERDSENEKKQCVLEWIGLTMVTNVHVIFFLGMFALSSSTVRGVAAKKTKLTDWLIKSPDTGSSQTCKKKVHKPVKMKVLHGNSHSLPETVPFTPKKPKGGVKSLKWNRPPREAFVEVKSNWPFELGWPFRDRATKEKEATSTLKNQLLWNVRYSLEQCSIRSFSFH